MSGDQRTDDDQLGLYDGSAERAREIREAGERWDRKVAHLARCTREPWWECQGDCDE